jgi:hypothetical protein
MKIAVLTANLGNFDNPILPVKQDLFNGVDEVVYHRFTDDTFPPITGLSPRLQYRIPKLFGWELFPMYDIYLWIDGSMSLPNSKSIIWFVEHLGKADIAFFKHPWRKTMQEEVDHIEEYLQEGNEYITSRYKNGLHKEQYAVALSDDSFIDDKLFASTTFIYRNNKRVHEALKVWWFYQSRYYTCDQVNLMYALHKVSNGLYVNVINEHIFKNQYIKLVSNHK